MALKESVKECGNDGVERESMKEGSNDGVERESVSSLNIDCK